MKNKLWLIVLLVFLTIGIVGTVTASAAQKPTPPTIQTWGIPNPVGYTHDCGPEPANAVSCGAICYYIAEDSTTNQHELSCIPAWFTE